MNPKLPNWSKSAKTSPQDFIKELWMVGKSSTAGHGSRVTGQDSVIESH